MKSADKDNTRQKHCTQQAVNVAQPQFQKFSSIVSPYRHPEVYMQQLYLFLQGLVTDQKFLLPLKIKNFCFQFISLPYKWLVEDLAVL